MIVGRPCDNITLQFSRPGLSRPTPWRITLPRVLPRQPTRVQSVAPTKHISPPAPLPSTVAKLDSNGTSPVFVRGPEVGVRVVVSTSEIWFPPNRYGDQDEQEAVLKRQVMLPNSVYVLCAF